MSNQTTSEADWKQHWYRVFQPELDTVAFDPLDPAKRYHTGIFVETEQELDKGTLFHVTGDVIAGSGMIYEERDNYAPTKEEHFVRSPQIGWILKTDYHSGRFSNILRALPRPTKQQGLNFWKPDPNHRRTEIIWTKENGEPYGPGEERRPVMKCNEWTEQLAIPKLRAEGVFVLNK
jgi:hypothetical protein